ncbi:MAG: hypothetical protein R3C68_07920 [Myxococcota bacterium]
MSEFRLPNTNNNSRYRELERARQVTPAPKPVATAAGQLRLDGVPVVPEQAEVATSLAPASPPQIRFGNQEVQSAKGFAGQIGNMGRWTSDPDSLMAAFLKLQIFDISENQDFTAMLDEAKSLLRKSAFVQEKRLRSLQDEIPELEQQADEAEARASEDLQRGRATLGSTDSPSGHDVSEGSEDPGAIDARALEDALYDAAYDSAINAIDEAAQLRYQAQVAHDAGDFEKSEVFLHQAEDIEYEIRTAFADRGIELTDEQGIELENYALARQAEGGQGPDAMDRFLLANPQLAGEFTGGDVSTGGAGLARELFTADRSDENLLTALLYTDEATVKQVFDTGAAPSTPQLVPVKVCPPQRRISSVLGNCGPERKPLSTVITARCMPSVWQRPSVRPMGCQRAMV